MVTLEQLVQCVRTELDDTTNEFDPSYTEKIGPALLEFIVRRTIAGLGLYVTNSGEVGDPRPPPTVIFSGLRQNGVHYKGQRRRRGGRR